MTTCHWLLVVYSYGVIFYHYIINHMLVAITTASIYILVWALCQGLDQVTLENCVFCTVADNVVQECTWVCQFLSIMR